MVVLMCVVFLPVASTPLWQEAQLPLIDEWSNWASLQALVL
ncbi:hypothetical protein IMCC3088_2844 [Aequoribacter fuscus]|uniref:Uncharacterized protein n=1 Tax=Aequoribacter fuscus TaxID=2518989 RepID=F3L565_9GAMM|nr:hypothetical protein IMCC3088_2844 [Aequoribacter fuscus]